MTDQLRSSARFIVARRYRLPVFGRECAVRLLREGDRLGGVVLAEPSVAFFDTNGTLVARMSGEEFETAFKAGLADHRRADPEHPFSATPAAEPATLFGGPTLSPRPA